MGFILGSSLIRPLRTYTTAPTARRICYSSNTDFLYKPDKRTTYSGAPIQYFIFGSSFRRAVETGVIRFQLLIKLVGVPAGTVQPSTLP